MYKPAALASNTVDVITSPALVMAARDPPLAADVRIIAADNDINLIEDMCVINLGASEVKLKDLQCQVQLMPRSNNAVYGLASLSSTDFEVAVKL